MKKITFKKHHAFTMVELVFVIVVVGILSAILIPRMQTSRLYEAADQITSHIRYTQHLAMMDDKFDPTGGDPNWYKKRWQIFFHKTAANEWSYAIFTDKNVDGYPDTADEIATNPQDVSKHLVGRKIVTYATYDDADTTKTLNLSNTYDITNIVSVGGCPDTAAGTNILTIAFDYIGRPIKGHIVEQTGLYWFGADSRLISTPCTITLTNGANENINITIQPETGFVSSSVIF
jgi:prepilin-type N-terminal cleavage/methylation domain-containing protein